MSAAAGQDKLFAALRRANELYKMIRKALNTIRDGEDNDPEARRIVGELQKIYIRTLDDLNTAITDCPEDVRAIIKGLLYSKVIEELKANQKRSLWKTAVTRATTTTKIERIIREIEVVRADMTQLSAINQVSQTFHARLLLVMRMPGGAKDADLAKQFDGFPLDENGRPTFRPSAGWFLKQIDFTNARDLKEMESKVTTEGDDLQLIKRVEGEFFTSFQLAHFPYDMQLLTVTFSVSCAIEGPVPCELVKPKPEAAGIDVETFAFANEYELLPQLSVELGTLGATNTRHFPAMHIRACVRRRPGFVLINVALPSMVIALMPALSFFVELNDIGQKLELAVTTLLTSVTFKFVTAAYLPQIPYLTIIDKFVLMCNGNILAGFLFHGAIGMLINWLQMTEFYVDIANKASITLVVLLWISIMYWFWRTTRKAVKDDEQKLKSIFKPKRRLSTFAAQAQVGPQKKRRLSQSQQLKELDRAISASRQVSRQVSKGRSTTPPRTTSTIRSSFIQRTSSGKNLKDLIA